MEIPAFTSETEINLWVANLTEDQVRTIIHELDGDSSGDEAAVRARMAQSLLERSNIAPERPIENVEQAFQEESNAFESIIEDGAADDKEKRERRKTKKEQNKKGVGNPTPKEIIEQRKIISSQNNNPPKQSRTSKDIPHTITSGALQEQQVADLPHLNNVSEGHNGRAASSPMTQQQQ